MSIGSPNPLLMRPADAAPASTNYSLKFSGDSYLTRTLGTATDETTWTFSCWYKIGDIGGNATLLGGSASASGLYIALGSTGSIGFDDGSTTYFTTDNCLRDPSAWYHIVMSVDTDTPETKLYVNGDEVTSFATDSRSSYTSSSFNTSDATIYVGRYTGFTTVNADGLMADVHFIDGTVKVPSDFAETDSNGQWVPKEYPGSYGNNGYHLDFSDSADLGADAAGSNDFTTTNIGSHDQMGGSPTSGNNFATMNPVGDIVESVSTTFSEGNLTVDSGYRDNKIPSTIGVSSGKWYAEVRFDETGDQFAGIGREDSFVVNGTYLGGSDGGISHAVYITDGDVYTDAVGATALGACAGGDVMNIALDLDSATKKVWFGKNGTWSGTPGSSGGTTVTSGTWFFGQSYRDLCTWNFGQDSTFNNTETVATNADGNDIGEFHNTVPSGFLALCTGNLPAPGINNLKSSEEAFEAKIWDGTYDYDNTPPGSEEQALDIGFNPGISWIKDRENTAAYSVGYPDSYGHWLFDIIQGSGFAINPSGEMDEVQERSSNALGSGYPGISSFSAPSNGFTVKAPETNFDVDTGGGGSADTPASYVGWSWKLGSTGGTGTEEYNADAGISVVKWAGDDSDKSISHTLGAAPDMIWVNDLSAYDGGGNVFWHKDLTSDNYMSFNTADAQTSGADGYFQDPPNGASTLDVAAGLSYDGFEYQAYLFRSTEGFSKCGIYSSIGANPFFVFTGFACRFLVIKNRGAAYSWRMYDSARNTYNPRDETLIADSSQSEDSDTYDVDFLSNGFALRTAGQNATNTTGNDYIYFAFGDSFKFGIGE